MLCFIAFLPWTESDETSDLMAKDKDQGTGMLMMPVQLMSGHSVNIVYNNDNKGVANYNNFQPLCLTAKESVRDPRY